MAVTRALVVGAGGLAGIAWETGVLHGMSEAGVDVAAADLVVGTSAGATVAAQIGSGRPLAHWYARLVEPDQQNHELLPVGLSVAELWGALGRLLEEYPDPVERRRQVGAFALAAETLDEATRRAVVAGRFPGVGWGATRLAITAVGATSGDRIVFDGTSAVDLVDAVAASSAVPGVWPPVTIGAERYVDGGIYSNGNADLAAGYDRVLVVTMRASAELNEELTLVQQTGRSEVLLPDAASQAAFGTNPLDPAIRTPTAVAGFAQGQAVAASLAPFWAG
jgi:NTE family protein